MVFVFQVTKTKPQRMELTPEQIVLNTANFALGNKHTVREFLEKGGMPRTEAGWVSVKDYSTVVLVKKPVTIQTGTSNAFTSDNQRTVKRGETISPGLYYFWYDTESGLTLRRVDDMAKLTKTAFGVGSGASEYGVSAKYYKIPQADFGINQEMLAPIIKNTVDLYKSNQDMAGIMEQGIDALYRKGRADRPGMPFGEEMQSQKALLAFKKLVNGLMDQAETGYVNQLAAKLADMATVTLPIGNNMIRMASEEILAKNKTTDNLFVSFDVNAQGRIVLDVYEGTAFSPGDPAFLKPVVVWRVEGDWKASGSDPVQFSKNAYSRTGAFAWVDYNNPAYPGENKKQDDMKSVYKNATDANVISGIVQQTKLFPIVITVPSVVLHESLSENLQKELK